MEENDPAGSFSWRFAQGNGRAKTYALSCTLCTPPDAGWRLRPRRQRSGLAPQLAEGAKSGSFRSEVFTDRGMIVTRRRAVIRSAHHLFPAGITRQN